MSRNNLLFGGQWVFFFFLSFVQGDYIHSRVLALCGSHFQVHASSTALDLKAVARVIGVLIRSDNPWLIVDFITCLVVPSFLFSSSSFFVTSGNFSFL